MPKKIKVVDVVSQEVKNEEVTASVNVEVVNDEPVEVFNEITSPTGEVINDQIPDIEEIPKTKPKTKAKPRAKPKQKPIEVMPEIKEAPFEERSVLPITDGGKVKEEVKEEPQDLKSDKIKKVVELVKCEKCNKMLSQKSLRYTHENNCPGKVVKTEELPVKRRVKPITIKPQVNNNITNSNEEFNDIPADVKMHM